VRRMLLVVVIGLVAGPALAGPEILPISGTGYLVYDEATGEITPQPGPLRYTPFWAATEISGFYPLTDCEAVLDWGDIVGPAPISCLGFTQYTNSQAVDGDLLGAILVYEEENGWNSTGRVCVYGLLIENIPGSTHPPDGYWGYVWAVELSPPLVLDGSDLDGDGLVDFGYSFWFSVNTPGAVHGPGIAMYICDPNSNFPNFAPGADEWYDLFDVCPPDDGYVGTYSLGPFRQLFWAMSGTPCPNRGASGKFCMADIDGSYDCIVGLEDLAQLLAHYGLTTGATPLMGDVDPYEPRFPGDGDVDLADLAELLSQYGDNCNWP
jgi:hypothetical protein